MLYKKKTAKIISKDMKQDWLDQAFIFVNFSTYETNYIQFGTICKLNLSKNLFSITTLHTWSSDPAHLVKLPCTPGQVTLHTWSSDPAHLAK